MNRSAACCCLVLASLGLAACDALRPVEIPIPTRFYDSGKSSDHLVIFLPGLGDDVDSFEQAGFVDQLHESRHPADAVVADAHLGYYLDSSFTDRLYEDILVPYADRGYSHILVAGVSLGGMGAIRMKHAFGDRVEGIVMFAPFLGNETLVEAIDHAGGVHTWRSGLDREPDTDERIWIWVEELVDPESGDIADAILAYGLKDKFAGADSLLARSMPRNSVFTSDGGHDWDSWSELWSDVLESDSWSVLMQGD